MIVVLVDYNKAFLDGVFIVIFLIVFGLGREGYFYIYFIDKENWDLERVSGVF